MELRVRGGRFHRKEGLSRSGHSWDGCQGGGGGEWAGVAAVRGITASKRTVGYQQPRLLRCQPRSSPAGNSLGTVPGVRTKSRSTQQQHLPRAERALHGPRHSLATLLPPPLWSPNALASAKRALLPSLTMPGRSGSTAEAPDWVPSSPRSARSCLRRCRSHGLERRCCCCCRRCR